MLPLKVGAHVKFVDEQYVEHDALITCVHGEDKTEFRATVNLLYVSKDPAKHDPYGNQIERKSSVVHQSRSTVGGYVWREPDEVPLGPSAK